MAHDQKIQRGPGAGLVAILIILVLLGGIIAAFVIWGWATVIGAVILFCGVYWWMFRTEYNNPGWKQRQQTFRSLASPNTPAGIPQPPSERGWKLTDPLPGMYTPDACPRCGRKLLATKPGTPHTASGRRWCPGINGHHYFRIDGILQYVEPSAERRRKAASDFSPELRTRAASAAQQRLAEVSRLHAIGLLTDAEYQGKRAEILGQL